MTLRRTEKADAGGGVEKFGPDGVLDISGGGVVEGDGDVPGLSHGR